MIPNRRCAYCQREPSNSHLTDSRNVFAANRNASGTDAPTTTGKIRTPLYAQLVNDKPEALAS